MFSLQRNHPTLWAVRAFATRHHPHALIPSLRSTRDNNLYALYRLVTERPDIRVLLFNEAGRASEDYALRTVVAVFSKAAFQEKAQVSLRRRAHNAFFPDPINLSVGEFTNTPRKVLSTIYMGDAIGAFNCVRGEPPIYLTSPMHAGMLDDFDGIPSTYRETLEAIDGDFVLGVNPDKFAQAVDMLLGKNPHPVASDRRYMPRFFPRVLDMIAHMVKPH